MKQEEKQLLLKDLCARLPYGAKVFYEYVDNLDKKTYGYSLTLNTWCIDELKAEKAIVKPYLRPLSSMTKEEQKEFVGFHCVTLCPIIMKDCLTIENECNMFDWLNAHHFDVRHLIEKNLAIEVTEENNPYKE